MMLREIAKDILKEPRMVKLDLSFRMKIQVTRDEAGNRLKIFILDPAVKGDTWYRTFPVQDVLIPNRIQLEIKWAARADTSAFTNTVFRNQKIGVADTMVVDGAIPAFDPASDTLMVRNVVLFYDSLALAGFMNRLWLINDYYASLAVIDSLNALVKLIKPDDIARLPLTFMQVQEIDKAVAIIEGRNFGEMLLRGGYDPKGFSEKFIPMFKYARSVNFTFREELLKSGAIPWNGNLDELAGYFTGRQLSYVRRAQLMDAIHGKIYRDYIDHWFSSNSFGDDLSIAATLLSKMYPDVRGDTLMAYLSKKIYMSYEQTSLHLMEEGRYADAFSLMENAILFRKSNPFFTNGSDEDRIMKLAAGGIYSSYAGIAASCLEAGKLTMADDYLYKARQFRTERSTFITSDSLYEAVFSRLFFMRNAGCDQILEQARYAEALDCYRFLEVTYDKQSLMSVKSELDAKIDRCQRGVFYQLLHDTEEFLRRDEVDSAFARYEAAIKLQGQLSSGSVDRGAETVLDSLAPVFARIGYHRLFISGSVALEQRQFTLALAQFDEARALSQKYGMASDPDMDVQYYRALKQNLLIRLTSNQKMIWNNQFDNAGAFLYEIRNAAIQYGLDNDGDVVYAIDKYSQKIAEQRCRNLNDSVEVRIIASGRSIALKNYILALRFLREAVTLTVSSNECRYPVKPVLDTIRQYEKPAEYQQKVLDATTHSAMGEYLTVVTEMEEACAVYRTNHLERYFPEPVSVYDFIWQRNNVLLTETAFHYYKNTDHKTALRYLQLLGDQGFPEKRLTELKKQLGSPANGNPLK